MSLLPNVLSTAARIALIFGWTEVGVLLCQDNVPVPVFDTTLVHCDAALTRR